jgi:hypothetical protein
VVGSFEGTMTYTPDGSASPLTATTSGATGATDAFVFKLAPSSGAITWMQPLGGTGVETAAAVAVDSSGGVYVGGAFSADFSPANGLSLTNQGGTDAWVIKLNSGGTPQWVLGVGASGDESVGALAVTSSGEVAGADGCLRLGLGGDDGSDAYGEDDDSGNKKKASTVAELNFEIGV